jgi:ribose transport system ATP-binding protein
VFDVRTCKMALERDEKMSEDTQFSQVLSLEHISKSFAATLALNDVSFDLRKGEVHALLGQNGAGKSTLIKILAGVIEPDKGTIRYNRQVVEPAKQRLPIAFIHQDLGLVDNLTVAENIAIATGYPKRFGLVSWAAAHQSAAQALEAVSSSVDPEAKVGSLALAEKSLIAIARALAIKSSILVLDEPTAALPTQDVDRLLTILERLRRQGIAMIYITHRLDEVSRIADRITVLRDGRRVSTVMAKGHSHEALVHNIVGKALIVVEKPMLAKISSTLLEIKDLQVNGVGPVSFDLGAGEILGLVGLRGAGHHSVGRALFGVVKLTAGEIRLGGKPINVSDAETAMQLGFGFVSSKRAEESLALPMSVRENLYLNPAAVGRYVFWPFSVTTEQANTQNAIRQFSLRPPNGELMAGSLSGGNQQKVVLARWLEAKTRILILEEPTIGVDVGAKAEIYALLEAAIQQGMGVLLISSDFEEVARIAHRALVFNHGRITAEIAPHDMTIARLTGLAAGATTTELLGVSA